MNVRLPGTPSAGAIAYEFTTPSTFEATYPNGFAHFEVVFLQDGDHDSMLDELRIDRTSAGVDEVFSYLLQWEYGDEVLVGTPEGTRMPWGSRDDLIIVRTPSEDLYVISHNEGLGYTGLIHLAA